jgi:cytochrome P450
VNFLDPDLITDPYPTYARWQADSPIFRAEDTGQWVLTRHDDVRSVLKSSVDYSSKAMGEQGNPLPLLTDDPPKHTQLRALVDRAFTMRMLKLMEDWVDDLARDMVATLPAGEPVDIVQALTIPLPVAVISRMMGIPAGRADDFKRWSDALTGTLAGASMEDRQQDILEMAAFFQDMIPERRSAPGEDLISSVANAEIEGERLTDQEIVGFCILLLIAGNETTTNLLGNLFNIAADRPEVWSALSDDPKLIDAAVEETLRFDAPVQFLMRKATRPMHYHGQDVAEGENVTVVMAAANRDPDVYEHPDQFRLDRKKNHHHTFGFGIHFCIGAPLARMEARMVLKALTNRFSRLERPAEAPGENERVASPLLRGFHHLWLTFSE